MHFFNDDEEEEARRVSLYKCSGNVVPSIDLENFYVAIMAFGLVTPIWTFLATNA